jgi:hypothetical protein
MFVVNPHFGHTISGFFSRSETLICIALPQAWHLIGNSASPKRFDSIFAKHSTLGKAHRIGIRQRNWRARSAHLRFPSRVTLRRRTSRRKVERKVAPLNQTRAVLVGLVGPAVFALSAHSGPSRCVQRRLSRANATYITVACFPEFPVRNRDLYLGAAIPQINGCSGQRARRFPRRLSGEQTDFRLSMRHKLPSSRPA